jgi:hypothetical protein
MLTSNGHFKAYGTQTVVTAPDELWSWAAFEYTFLSKTMTLQKIPPHCPCQPNIQTPILVQESLSPVNPFFCFFITFFLSIDIGAALRAIHPLCNDLERRTQGNSLLLTSLSIFILP